MTKIFMTIGSLMKVESIVECFCNTFDTHKSLISLENPFLVFLRVAVLHRFYCIHFECSHFGYQIKRKEA